MPFQSYYNSIESIHKENENAKEHSYRTPLQNLWQGIKGENFPILHEGSSENGTPDFTISNKGRHIVGFIECKDYDFPLKEALLGKKQFIREYEQIKKYLVLAPVVIFTNYIDFLLVTEPKAIKNQDAFIKLLARKTQILRDDILKECGDADSHFSKTEIHKLFSQTIYRELDEKDFADSFAQIITFGLLFTRLTFKKNISINTFEQMPEFIPLFRELLKKFEITESGKSVLYIVESIISTINIYDESMFFKESRYKYSHDKEDPFIYMYENFLKEFDNKTRNAKGVFYTPIEVVGYIVKSIDEILKDRLSLSQGILSKDVHILDFAAGTGTFLLGVIEYIYNNIQQNDNSGMWKNQVKDFILKNLYGFEYLVVPYVLAHFRIHQYLEDCDYEYERSDRLKLYLTNTLDNTPPSAIPMFPELNNESNGAHRIKNEEPILVVMGNPPYNNKSDTMNCKEWIMKLTDYYKEGLLERKINLNDDYIKFLRFAQWKMEQVDKGIVAVITNNGFINGITYREMRNKLMKTFDEIYVYDLHGNVNKGEKCPDGSQDSNIFNIKDVGVSILLFIKTGRKENKNKGVFHQEIFGTQTHKKETLVPSSWLKDTKKKKWQKIEDDKKWHRFVPVSANAKYWNDFKSLKDIFENINSGVKTDRDSLFIDFSNNEISQRMQILFNNCYDEKFKEIYNIYDSSSYPLLSKIKNHSFNKSNIVPSHYRPFDFRYIYYNKNIISCPASNIAKHMIGHDNIGLIFPRQVLGGYGFQHGLVSSAIVDVSLGGAKSGSETYFAPLYLYDDKNDDEKSDQKNKDDVTKPLAFNERHPNWVNNFAIFLCEYHTKKPEDILAYIYAVLYSPSYRTIYAKDLSYDYPRIPFTADKVAFTKLKNLGQKLIDLHLLKIAPKKTAGYPVEGSNTVEKVYYENNKLFINSTQYFSNVKSYVWEYSIGGYQVLDKYLKSRMGRVLSSDEILHVGQICGILSDTIDIQREIDGIGDVW